MGRRVALLAVAAVLAALSLPVAASPAVARDPTTKPGHMLGKTQTTGTEAAIVPNGFEDRTVFGGLTHPTNIAFASDGRVFIAEKSGLIKVFDSLTDTTPTTFADLRSEVDDYWDRGLLGLALAPTFPANPYVYVLYTYDAPIGGTPPVWSDACPSPPGPTTDGCVVSGRLARLQANGNVMTGQEQVLINDWCQQFPSHSIGTVRFGSDGALYVSGGDGASFNGADYGQYGGSAGSPTLTNPCGDPPGAVGTQLTLPAAEGGSLRSQDIRTMPTGGSGTGYAATVKADGPVAYWRLDEASGTSAADGVGTNTGTYTGGVTKGQPGATADGDTAVDLNGTTGYVSVNDAAAVRLGDGPFTLEAWVNRPTLGTTYPGDQEQVFDKNDGGYQVNIQNNVVYFDQAAIGTIAKSTAVMTTGWHHIVVTKNGAAVHVYQDGAEVTSAVTNRTLTDGTAKLVLGVRRGNSTAFLDGMLDEVAIYKSVLSPAQVAAHWAARNGSGGGGTSDPAGLDGTILRLDPTTGAAMAGNPLIASPDLNARRIISYGVRNPFRFTFRPGTTEMWIGDVGFSAWEEIDLLSSPTVGLNNYGWPCYEGNGHEGSYDNLNVNLCETLYANGTGAVTTPYYTYNHAAQVVPGETCPTANGSSISGLAFYTGGAYPSSYTNGLFFADYSRDCIWFMPAGTGGAPNKNAISTFVAGAANPVDLETGPGGDLFYADFDGGTIRRVVYTSGNQAPTAVIAANPTSGGAPLTVNFSGSGSSDPEGGALAYAWDFDSNGTDDATGVTTSHAYASGGTFLARLRVTDPQGASGTATATISVGNTPPNPTITTPSSTLTYSVGDSIAFSGSASDAEQGSIPASGLTWSIVLHHCPTDPNSCHTHVVQSFTGVASGSFTAPDHEYPSWIELILTATDGGGLTGTSSLRLDPKTVNLSFATSPTGLQLTVGSFTGTAPFTRTVIRNSRNTLSAPTPQTLGGQSYAWQAWSDGLAQTHDVIPLVDASYTATYQAVASSGYAATVKADGPVAYWRLDEASGTSAADGVGTNTGTYTGGVTKGQPGATADGDTAVDLNGTTGYVSVNDAAAVRLGDGPFTLEAWVNRPTLGTTYPGDQEQVFDKNDGGYQVNIQNNVVYFDQAAIGTIAKSTAVMTTGWHHIVVTKNGAAVHVYQDGAEVTSAVTNRTLTDGTAKLVLGVRRGNSTAFLDGMLDEVAIYKSVLSPAQVAAHWAARLATGS